MLRSVLSLHTPPCWNEGLLGVCVHHNARAEAEEQLRVCNLLQFIALKKKKKKQGIGPWICLFFFEMRDNPEHFCFPHSDIIYGFSVSYIL
jgi:hypothetical protein